eukprot:365440-Chlamydomonas_euryale.AAC.7
MRRCASVHGAPQWDMGCARTTFPTGKRVFVHGPPPNGGLAAYAPTFPTGKRASAWRLRLSAK